MARQAIRYAPETVDHFQHPRNVGRLPDATAEGRVDDLPTETTITIYVKVVGDRIERATFRTLGCSACVAASSVATVLVTGLAPAAARTMNADALDRALGGLPPEKRYCAELAADAISRALDAAEGARSGR